MLFQSRNRESSNFNYFDQGGAINIGEFQSRNRESSNFNVPLYRNLLKPPPVPFQSRNRESSNFNHPFVVSTTLQGDGFQSRNRESSNFNQ